MKHLSAKRRSTGRDKAAVFAALGDETRLLLLAKLCRGRQYSIAELTRGTKLTRQAVTRHLRVLQRVRMVHGRRAGRQNLFQFDPKPVNEMKEYLELVSRQWDGGRRDSMYHEVQGTGKPLVYIPMGFGVAGITDSPALTRNRMLITFDLQGRRRTAGIDRPLSFQQQAGDIWIGLW